jgi:hypothetical protein
MLTLGPHCEYGSDPQPKFIHQFKTQKHPRIKNPTPQPSSPLAPHLELPPVHEVEEDLGLAPVVRHLRLDQQLSVRRQNLTKGRSRNKAGLPYLVLKKTH